VDNKVLIKYKYKMKYIILTGHRKSGTTLLHRLFDNHPELNIYPTDISLLYAYYPYWTNKNLSASELKDRFSIVIQKSMSVFAEKIILKNGNKFDPNIFLKIIWKNYKPTDLVKPDIIIDAVSNSYCEYLELDKSLPFVFKETSQIINLKQISSNNPDVKMLQIIRDPRDNYAAIKVGVSNYYKKFGEDEMESLASMLNRTKFDLELARREIENKSSKFYTVHFEDLTTSSETTLKKITNDLKIKWHNNLKFPTLLGEEFTGNNHSGDKFKGISSNNIGKWKERISKNEACIIEGWLADIMTYWGYQLEYSHDDHVTALSDFYAWYNCKYFFRDSFTV
jgi:hypothetical protein